MLVLRNQHLNFARIINKPPSPLLLICCQKLYVHFVKPILNILLLPPKANYFEFIRAVSTYFCLTNCMIYKFVAGQRWSTSFITKERNNESFVPAKGSQRQKNTKNVLEKL